MLPSNKQIKMYIQLATSLSHEAICIQNVSLVEHQHDKCY